MVKGVGRCRENSAADEEWSMTERKAWSMCRPCIEMIRRKVRKAMKAMKAL